MRNRFYLFSLPSFLPKNTKLFCEYVDFTLEQYPYIRLTNLHPKLLEYVDESRIAFTSVVELSYLNDIEQQDLIQTIESEDCTPSLSQAVRMKKLSQAGELDDDKILEIMSEEKANQKERIKIPTEKLRKYFPRDFSTSQIEDTIIKMCEANYKRRQKQD